MRYHKVLGNSQNIKGRSHTFSLGSPQNWAIFRYFPSLRSRLDMTTGDVNTVENC
jgi:hypothetical protein